MSDADLQRLPARLRRAWGSTTPAGRRGRKASLTLDRIIDVAVDLADADGIGGPSLVRVAERLEVTPNALYRYLDSREELEILLRERALASPPAIHPDAEWRKSAREWAHAVLARYTAHPWLADLRTTVPITPNALGWLEALLAALAGSGLDNAATLRAAALLDGYVRSQFLTGRDLERWGEAESDQPDTVAPLLAARGLDRVSALFARGEYVEPVDASLRRDFEFGLDVLLDGLAARGR